MLVATWNINGLRARLEFIQHWLRARQPDLVGFQELKMTDDQFPHATFEALGYRVVTHGQKGWNGVAVLARESVEVTQRGLPGGESQGARLLSARVDALSFTTIYCPNGKTLTHEDYPKKLAWLDALGDYVATQLHVDRPAILCGDFNICPAPIDSWNDGAFRGQIFHTDAERSRFRRLLDWGFVDVFRHCHPSTQAFTWWDYRAGALHKQQGLRLDFLLATPPLMERVKSVEIDREYRKKKDGLTASDHAPVVIDLD